MPLDDYTFTFNNLTIGAGTVYPILSVDGLASTSTLRIQDDNRGYLDGSWTGRDFYDERTVYIELLILGNGGSTAQENYLALQFAFAPQQIAYYPDPTGITPTAQELQPFLFKLSASDTEKIMYGRSRGLQTLIDADYGYGYIKCRIQMTFPDPRYYDNEGTDILGVASADVWNEGWAESCPVITINSPNASGSITDGYTSMDFANVPTTSPLIIDLLSRVIWTGAVPARNLMTISSNGWLGIPPNISSLSPYTWTSTVGDMEFTFRNAFV